MERTYEHWLVKGNVYTIGRFGIGYKLLPTHICKWEAENRINRFCNAIYI